MTSPGSQIGPYSVTREIGRGGMGVVYLARDERLDRDVALKALPEDLAADQVRMERFEREAKSLAHINHTNIAGIHGVEEQDGRKYLILEYVEGETLGERLDRGPVPVDEAIEIAIGIAFGVEAAHEAGVIHRDLKPDNIKITPDGHVKILDFGLAKIEEASTSTGQGEVPTLTTPRSPTIPGAILGTAAYMSPEQARGRRIDKRTDIFSFGVLLYEMLTGASPFAGESASDSIGAVLHKDVDLGRLPVGTPATVRRVVERCLVRDKDLRYRDIGDVRLELLAIDDVRAEPAPASRLSLATGAALVAIAAIVVGAAVWFLKPVPAPAPPPLVHADIPLPEGMRLAHNLISSIAISPDGQSIVFPVGDPEDYEDGYWFNEGLMIRHLDQAEATPIGGASDECLSPAISPDGSTIAYVRMNPEIGARGVMTVPITGGTPKLIGEIGWTPYGLTWTEGGQIVVGSSHGLDAIASLGGSFAALTTADVERNEDHHASPHALPGDRGVLFTVVTEAEQLSVWVVDSTGQRRELLDNASHPQYVDGHMLFARRGALFAAPFDLDNLEVTGEPRPLGINTVHAIYSPNSMTRNGMAQYSVARSGNLAFAEGSVYPPFSKAPVWVDRDGVETPIDVPARPYGSARLSADGTRAILTVSYEPQSAAWELDVARGVMQRVFAGDAMWGIPGPGDRVILTENRSDGAEGVAFIEPDAPVSRPESLNNLWGAEWLADGQQLLCVRERTSVQIVVWTEEAGVRVVVADPDVNYRWPTVSPDGRWLAYTSNISGRHTVYVRPFQREGRAVLVSGESAEAEPVWSSDGSELFYRDKSDKWMMAVTVTIENDSIEFGRPTQLFADDKYSGTFPVRNWDVAPDGRFLMLPKVSKEERIRIMNQVFPDRIRIIQSWTSTLERTP